jgi:hypothetical protein
MEELKRTTWITSSICCGPSNIRSLYRSNYISVRILQTSSFSSGIAAAANDDDDDDDDAVFQTIERSPAKMSFFSQLDERNKLYMIGRVYLTFP